MNAILRATVLMLYTSKTLPKSYEAELVEDIMSLVASSSSKIYGKRSAENRRKNKIQDNKKEGSKWRL
jgi:predicted site-specific integrase-resolvase